MPISRSKSSLLHAIFLLSGAAGLGYQIIWSKQFALGLGHEIPSLLAVVAAFFLGMALGAWKLGDAIRMSPNPGRWYGGLELLLGAWGVVSTVLVPVLNQAAMSWMGAQPATAWHWAVAFAVPTLALLPATVAMGATLPAMEQFLAQCLPGRAHAGSLYAVNTLGAALGAFGIAHALLPQLGFRASLVVLAVVNALCGVTMLLTAGPATSTRAERTRRREFPAPPRLLGILFLTGLLGIGFEVVTVRVLAQILENTVYTFAATLAVYLLGTALGAALQRFAQSDATRILRWLPGATGAAAAVGVVALAKAPGIYHSMQGWLGAGLAEVLLAVVVLGPVTICMGALFAGLINTTNFASTGLGRALAWNNFGGALAGLIFPILLLPVLGSKLTLLVICLGYVTLMPFWGAWKWPIAAAAAILLVVTPLNLRLIDLPPGAKLIEYREGVLATVAVIETSDGHRSLRVNNRFQMGGTAVAVPQRRQAAIPLLLHPAPRKALFLGPGTGITLGAAAAYPDLEVDAVELVPEVVGAMRAFATQNGAPYQNPRIHIHTGDARRFIRATATRYDVIIADLFHPSLDGAGALYTREHFQATRDRLAPHGLFCQWLPLHQLDAPTLRTILRSFLEVFPDAQAWLLHFNVDIPVLGLVGGNGGRHYAADWIEQRAQIPGLTEHLRATGLNHSLNLLGTFAAGPTELRVWAGKGPLNTDDNPRVMFSAGRAAYSLRGQPHQLLLDFLTHNHPDARVLTQPGSGVEADGFATNLANFITARDIYLRGLAQEVEGHLQPAITDYLAAARASLHFTPAYARCVTIIQVLARTDLAGARVLFRRLEEAQPAQPLGKKLLGPLFEPKTGASTEK